MKYDSEYVEKSSTRPATGGDAGMLASSIGICWLLVFLLSAGVIGFLWRTIDGGQVHLGRLLVISIAIASMGTLHLFRWMIAEIWVDMGMFRNIERSGTMPDVMEQPAQELVVNYTDHTDNTVTILRGLYVDKDKLIMFAISVQNGQSLSKENWTKFFGKDRDGEWLYDRLYRQMLMYKFAEPVSETAPTHGIRLTPKGERFIQGIAELHSPTVDGYWSNPLLEAPTTTNEPKQLDIKENEGGY
jgi:hypothetical protein